MEAVGRAAPSQRQGGILPEIRPRILQMEIRLFPVARLCRCCFSRNSKGGDVKLTEGTELAFAHAVAPKSDRGGKAGFHTSI